MADENNGAQQQGEGTQQGQQGGQQPEAGENARQAKYTDADIDAIIARKFARWQEQQEAKAAEAAKLAEMNATQKAEYERDQLQKRLDELERERSVSGGVPGREREVPRMRRGFRTDQDVYSRECSAWTRDDLYACNRWISRIVCKAPRSSFYASILRGLNVTAMNGPSRVFFRCALKEVPAARPLLAPEALAAAHLSS